MRNKNLWESVFPILLFLASFFYLSYNYRYYDLRIYHYDEGASIYGAVRILNGDTPYRDFWTFHMPGRFYIMVALFKVFGISLEAVVLFAIFIWSLSSCVIYLFVSRVLSKAFGMLAFVLVLALLKSFFIYSRPGQFAILFYILSWLPLLKYLSCGKKKWLFVTGILTGIIGFFRIDFEIYSLSALSLIVLGENLYAFRENKAKPRLMLKEYSCLFIGFLLTSLPNHIFYIYNGGFREFKNHILSGTLLRNRFLPLSELKVPTLIFYSIPLLIFLITSVKLFFFGRAVEKKDKIFWLRLFLLFSGFCFYVYSITRADLSRLIPTMIPVTVLFIFLYYDLIRILGKYGYFCKYFVLTAVFFASFLLLCYSVGQNVAKSKFISQNVSECKFNLSRAKEFYDCSEYAKFQMQAIRYIQSKTEKKEKIFVGNLRHDRLTNNDILFYFLSERESATRYFIFEPGFTNSKMIQRRIIDDLIKENVRYIVLWAASEGIIELNESNMSSKTKDLDDFIRENYKVDKTFEDYIILRHI